MRIRAAIVGVACLLGLSGCGTTSGSFLAAALGITIVWPELSTARSFNPPESAQSAVFRLTDGAGGGHDLVMTMNRDVGPEGGSQRYTAPVDAKVGTWDYVIDFFSGPNGTGDIVASDANRMTVFPDGSNSTDGLVITPVGRIATVVVDPGQVLQVGETRFLTVTARDSSGRVIALPPGAVFFTVVNGATSIRFDRGQAVGLAAGRPTVTARVNNVTSTPPETVIVTTGAGGLDVGIN